MWRLYLLWRGAGIGAILGEIKCRKCETAKTSSNTSITDGNGITLSLVRPMVSFLIRTARNSLPPLRLMKTEIQML